jgi:hypothetical protein
MHFQLTCVLSFLLFCLYVKISMVKVEQQVFTLTEPGPIFCILYKKWQLKEECFLRIGYLTGVSDCRCRQGGGIAEVQV